MSPQIYFITHPNVVVSPEIPVPQWPLSERGRERMRNGLKQPWVATLGSIYCSSERKAQDGAQILGAHLNLPYSSVAALGENDRSATGFLAAEEFERTADQFFANPCESVRGWETAYAAQRRIKAAVEWIIAHEVSKGSIAIISHGAVGTLLYCHLVGRAISRLYDQPSNGGGNYYCFPIAARIPKHHWRPIDEA